MLDGDATEQERVYESCKSRGFFYLELAGCQYGDTILRGADGIARLGKRIGQLSMDEKMKYQQCGTLFGYKPAGFSVLDKQPTRDSGLSQYQ